MPAHSDVTETEMIRANGGKPLSWPDGTLERIAYCIWLRENLRAFVPKERLELAVMMGSHGNADTAAKFWEAWGKLGTINGLNMSGGWPTGMAGILRLIQTDPEDWPHSPERYKL